MRLKSFKFLIIALTFFVGFGNTQAQEVAMDEMLDMDLSELMNVPIVIASKKSEGSFTAPLSTTVLSREEIEKSGVTSIEEAFRLVPGMFVRQRTNGNFDVHIRGNDNVPPQN
nr:Plug domain-containing protein [Breznakibacter sp.]